LWRAAFTLIELLVVVTIIGVLAALLFPVFGNIRAAAQASKCTNNLRQIATALMTYESENGMMPWYQAGPWGSSAGLNGNLNWRQTGTSWYDTLINAHYLPAGKSNGVWLCPAVPLKQSYANNWGGYGICGNIFRREINKGGFGMEEKGSQGIPLKTDKVPRPSQTWLIGDCAMPDSKTLPGSVIYTKTYSYFGRPAQVGGWSQTASQPALRHRGMALWAAFDGHIQQLTWSDMLIEKDNFTARNESF